MTSRGSVFFTLFFACLIFGAMGFIITPSKENFSLFFVFQFLLMLVHYLQQKSWLAAFWTLFIFNNILSIFLSLDMFYEEKIGLFVCTKDLNSGEMALVFLLGFYYLGDWKVTRVWKK